MDKFTELMEVFAAWSKLQKRGESMKPRIIFNEDGSGSLSNGYISTSIEFADVDEVLVYMKRRLPKVEPV